MFGEKEQDYEHTPVELTVYSWIVLILHLLTNILLGGILGCLILIVQRLII